MSRGEIVDRPMGNTGLNHPIKLPQTHVDYTGTQNKKEYLTRELTWPEQWFRCSVLSVLQRRA